MKAHGPRTLSIAVQPTVVPAEPTYEFGLNTFGDVTVDEDGEPLSQATVIRNVVEEARLADARGLDFFGVGEHHRADFAISSPEVVLAAIAGVTSRIRIGSAVTVLSSDDPVRVFERFATLDAVSNGRAEVIVGRGSFTESFPLFGLELADYARLFEEKIELFTELLREEPVTWSGATRASLSEQSVYPKTASGRLTTWIGVGGSPESVVRAAHYGIPMMLAIIGGDPARFVPYARMYRDALEQLGKDPLPIGIHSPGYIAETDDEARDSLWPYFETMQNRIGAERGWAPMSREDFEDEAEHGSIYVGSPEHVASRIAAALQSLDASRFDLKYSNGAMPHAQLLSSIELFADEVVPRVRELLKAGAGAA